MMPGEKTMGAEAFLAAHPETRFVDALTFDLAGNALGKRYAASELPKLMAKGLQFCSGTLLLDVAGVTHDVAGMGFADGDPDWPAVAIPGTLAPVPWGGGNTAQFLFRMLHPTESAGWWCDPRVILERVVARLDELRFRAVIACELEFYLIDAARDADGRLSMPALPGGGPVPDAPRVFGMDKLEEFADFIGEIDGACRAQGLPVGAASSEYGRGQYEVNLEHVDDPVAACDQALLLRRAVGGIARARGMDATFMSKPYTEQAGNGLHIHLSLVDEEGHNVFDERREGGASRLRHAIGGMRATMYESMAIFAPNVNAYRRFAANNFLPVNRSWAENNRSVAFRIPSSSPGARRIEHRVAGAEANPYLVAAAVLAGAHHGLSEAIDPGPPAVGNAGERVDPEMPLKLWTALERMRAGEILPGYLGADYVRAYADLKEAEFEAFFSEILTREYDWYL